MDKEVKAVPMPGVFQPADYVGTFYKDVDALVEDFLDGVLYRSQWDIGFGGPEIPGPVAVTDQYEANLTDLETGEYDKVIEEIRRWLDYEESIDESYIVFVLDNWDFRTVIVVFIKNAWEYFEEVMERERDRDTPLDVKIWNLMAWTEIFTNFVEENIEDYGTKWELLKMTQELLIDTIDKLYMTELDLTLYLFRQYRDLLYKYRSLEDKVRIYEKEEA